MPCGMDCGCDGGIGFPSSRAVREDTEGGSTEPPRASLRGGEGLRCGSPEEAHTPWSQSPAPPPPSSRAHDQSRGPSHTPGRTSQPRLRQHAVPILSPRSGLHPWIAQGAAGAAEGGGAPASCPLLMRLISTKEEATESTVLCPLGLQSPLESAWHPPSRLPAARAPGEQKP